MLTSALTRNRVLFTLTLLILFFVPFITVFAEAIPSTVPPDGIYDPSGYLDQETRDAIIKFNQDHAETDLQPQLGVAIVDYLDQDIESVANQTARNWKVGYKETNHGILLVIGVKDRKMRTEVSDRAATQITDWEASKLNDVLKPYFRNEHYSQGVQAYVAKLTKHFDHLAKKATSNFDPESTKLTFGGKIVLGIIITISLLAMLMTLISDLLDNRDSKYRAYDHRDGSTDEASESSHIVHHGSSSSADKSDSSDASDLLWAASALHGSSRSSSSSSRSSSSYSSSSSSSSSYDSDYSSSSSSSFSSSDWGGGGFGGGGASGGW